jgi:hypothetical protein
MTDQQIVRMGAETRSRAKRYPVAVRSRPEIA